MKKYEYYLKDLDCAACGIKIQDKIAEDDKYQNVIVNYNTLKLSFESDDEGIEIEEITEIVTGVEPEVEVFLYSEKGRIEAMMEMEEDGDEDEEDMDEEVSVRHHHHHDHKHDHEHAHGDKPRAHHHDHSDKKAHDHSHCHCGKCKTKGSKPKININILRVICGLVLGLLAMVIPNKVLSTIMMVVAYVILLYRTGKNAFKLIKGLVIDENLLVTISCIGAFLIGSTHEGLMVIVLYEIGKILEDKAVSSTRKSITELMDIRPDYANLKQGNDIKKVHPSEVAVGDIIVIKQGEKIPIDGVVVSGEAHLNNSSLTGETKLDKVSSGDTVLSGGINENGIIEVKTTEKFEDSTVSRILNLVENATDKKAKTETFVNRASRIYTPLVVGIATVVGIFLPLVSNVTYKESVYRALLFLVVSCPCAIVISVPLSYFTGIGKASKNGILIKGSNYIDILKDVSEIAFDKTGTLTKGVFAVSRVESYGKYSKDDLLKYAAYGESMSNHPIGRAIVEKYGQNIDEAKVYNFQEISGKGLTYSFDGKDFKLGNHELVGCEKEELVGTVVYIAVNNIPEGYILLKDEVKKEAKEVIDHFKRDGVHTYMFTGDNPEIAFDVGEELGVSQVISEMLPQDKYHEMERLIAKAKREEGKAAFVGDGINDAPVLALSDVGISMGGIGSSSAIEASDIVIMNDDLNKITKARKIAEYTTGIISQNLTFALAVKLFVLLLGFLGRAQMWQAVFADVGVTIITILNTLRILKKRF